MTDTVKDQLIVAQSIELMQLKSRLSAYSKTIENAERGQNEYREILEEIGDVLGYKGNYHTLAGVIKELKQNLEAHK